MFVYACICLYVFVCICMYEYLYVFVCICMCCMFFVRFCMYLYDLYVFVCICTGLWGNCRCISLAYAYHDTSQMMGWDGVGCGGNVHLHLHPYLMLHNKEF